MTKLEYKRNLYMTDQDIKESEFVREHQKYLVTKVIKYLNDNFTDSDRLSLKEGYWGADPYDILTNIGLNYLRHIYFLTSIPTEDLPLHINEEDRFNKLFVSWRLRIIK